jgi:hypothetical protein
VIHRSTTDRFLSKAAAAEKQVGELQQLTLNDLLADPDFTANLRNAFAVVPETATLADAKRAMGSLPSCQDVFVTRTGASTEPISGWITNVIIEDNSRVG